MPISVNRTIIKIVIAPAIKLTTGELVEKFY
jgi:hypothetical protein